MLPTISLQSAAELRAFLGDREILQEGNDNSYSRLFHTSTDQAAKIYTSNFGQVEKNLENLRLIAQCDKMYQIPAIVMPRHLVDFQGKIVGYTMDYVEGTPLSRYLQRRDVLSANKWNCFAQLADVINHLPDTVHIGDLHGENVLVDRQNQIHLIDIDGFSVDGGYHLTSPFFQYAAFQSYLPPKYLDSHGKAVINRETDIFCLFLLLINYLLGDNITFLSFSLQQKFAFTAYMKKRGYSSALAKAVERLFSVAPNKISSRMFRQKAEIQPGVLHLFLEDAEFIRKELEAKQQIDKISGGVFNG